MPSSVVEAIAALPPIVDRAAASPSIKPVPAGGWTKPVLLEVLTEAFRTLPDLPVWSPRKNTFVLVEVPGVILRPPPTPLELVGLTSHYLLREGRKRQQLLSWCRARARGASFAGVCRELGWNEKTADRNRRRGARMVVEGLNRDGVAVTLSHPGEPVLTVSKAA
jgi:hypothetical protein